ncbi:hypothetical protein HPB47_026407 [Ixodes persulcatus]|uniref:Uncharacterized protein n=1 Tax=Ixodes persulcatus TaxID=34615 RepID=A0AC60Q0L4_IXOPE|nr:hypothetical protein HPB47_026407 [Ixodes persulcatus]
MQVKTGLLMMDTLRELAVKRVKKLSDEEIQQILGSDSENSDDPDFDLDNSNGRTRKGSSFGAFLTKKTKSSAASSDSEDPDDPDDPDMPRSSRRGSRRHPRRSGRARRSSEENEKRKPSSSSWAPVVNVPPPNPQPDPSPPRAAAPPVEYKTWDGSVAVIEPSFFAYIKGAIRGTTDVCVCAPPFRSGGNARDFSSRIIVLTVCSPLCRAQSGEKSYYCCVRGCSSANVSDRDGLWLFEMPKEASIMSAWDNRLPLDYERNRPHSPRVCFRHFEKSDFVRRQQRLVGLREGALPNHPDIPDAVLRRSNPRLDFKDAIKEEPL